MLKHLRTPTLPESGEYFSRLRRPLRIGLLTAFIVPLVIISLYLDFHFNLRLKKSGKLNLTNLAESQRNTIDLFLQERVVNILNLFHAGDFTLSPSERDMESYLGHLRETSDAFVDVGFLDDGGIQSGYAGPYHYLQGRDYSDEVWFQLLMDRDQDYYISDIYLGFRRKPHFTTAVKQRIDGRIYIMRATLDPDKFFMFLRTLGDGKGGDSALINKEGEYQLVNPNHGGLLGSCDFFPSAMTGSGADEMETPQGSVLVAYAWLNEVPWILVVQQPLEIAYAEMYRVQWIMLTSIGALVLIIVGAVWITTGRLLRKAQAVQESRVELRSQLIHAAKLASVGELAAGVAHEINNPLAIISAETGVIRDMFDPRFELECTPEGITEGLDYIDESVFRAKSITQKLLDFARRNEPNLSPCGVNTILDEVVSGLKEQEFLVSNIELIREYDLTLPDALVDPDQVRQVFLNIVNNAGDAIEESGTITLRTSFDGDFVRVTVADTGGGMTPDQIDKIFLPFFTTKEVGKGTGLGLSISIGIIETMGGRIEVQSMLGKGSSFTVILPANQTEVPSNV